MLGIGLGVLYVAAIVLSLHGAARGDEIYHYAQIHLLRHGDFRLLDVYLTTIPGYHAAVAALLWMSGLDSLGAARAINALFGLAALAGFHALRRRLWPDTESIATAQLIALPILVPLCFLVYTDVLALALILWASVATLSRRHALAVLALSCVVLVRQNDVVWAAFLGAVAIWPTWREHGLARWRTLVAIGAPYAAPIALFLAFWAWNGSISLSHGQAALHPELTLHLGNPFFALFLAGALLPLQTLAGLRRFAEWTRARPWLIVVPLVLFALYWWAFHADNPYNSALPDFYPRNAFLQALDRDAVWRALAGVVMVLAACGLAPTKLRPREAAWLYPFAALFLAASWLIEQRYVLVPLVLWLAFREHRSRAIEYATLALWLALAVYAFSGIIGGRFFL
ncbi:hypothetical protein [Dokdonella soli]|uniref:Glycosyltransferase RgtA/B/C/D-like domain-containing protein n=1 Tax=Dokdonella soli TaxID=529810 RepID=A0ABN1IC84_9GAMM